MTARQQRHSFIQQSLRGPLRLSSLISQALSFDDVDAYAASEVGFMARALVQATMPHSEPKTNECVWHNGHYTLSILGSAAAVQGPDQRGGDLRLVYLVGCGAVGSAMAYLVPLAGLLGRFGLADRDLVDDSNLNRSPPFTALDTGRTKVEVSAGHLRRNGVPVQALEEWFDDAVRSGQLFQRPAGRGDPDRQRARIPVFHPGPSPSASGLRDHRAQLGRLPRPPRASPGGLSGMPVSESAVGTRTSARVRSDADATGDGPRVQGEIERRALPFLSTAAALLAVAELVKISVRRRPVNPNFACLDFRGDLSDFVLDQRAAARSCRCASQRRVWPALNGRSRFAFLSTTTAAPDPSSSSATAHAGVQQPEVAVTP